MLNRILIFVSVVVLLLAFGCGGGGGGGSSGGNGGNGGNGGTFGPIRVEAVNGSNKFVELKNIQVGDDLQFQLVHYSTGGVRQVVGVSGSWSTNDAGNQAGVLSSNGSYSANAVSATTYTASATSSTDGQVYQGQYKVLGAQASVRGRLIDTNNKNVAGVTVLFYNSGGTQVGSCVTSGGGDIYAALPTSATRFNLSSGTINTSLYDQFFTFNGKSYSPIIVTCTAPLPSLTNGVTSSLATFVVLYSINDSSGNPNSPPPPPTGCGG